MAGSDLTSVSYIYMRRYSDKMVANQARRDHPTLDQISVEGGFNGEAHYYFITYSNPQGLGDFTNAHANVSGSKGVQLRATRSKQYGVITLDGEAMAASTGSNGAIYDLVTRETDGIINEHGDTLAFQLFRDGNGQRGKRASASTNVITLTVTDDVRNFRVGMTVIASANANGSSPRTGSTTVTSIDEDSGTITLTSAAAITSFADNDFLFRSGEQNGAGMQGMESATPLTAPTAGDSFRGIDRSVDVRGLAGARLAATSTPEEDIARVAVSCMQRNKRLKRAAINPVNFYNVVRRLQAKVEYQGAGGTADWGFEFINLVTAAGTIKLYSDPDCPTTRARAFDPAAHYIKTLKDMVHIIRDGNDQPNMTVYNADAIEIRTRSMLNYFQSDPAAHAVVSI